MAIKKIVIDNNVYIKYFNNNDYELHIRASGPNGSWVYKYENGLLKWRQRRSYSFISRLIKPMWIDNYEDIS
jgi:hypothetical protein